MGLVPSVSPLHAEFAPNKSSRGNTFSKCVGDPMHSRAMVGPRARTDLSIVAEDLP